MASFAEIMQQMQPQQPQMTPVPLPYVPGMPQAQQVQLPQVGPVDITPTPMAQAPAQAQAPQAQGQVPPEEMAQRKQSWKAVLDGFMAQPNAKELMMLVGMKLLQGRRPGQSVGSQFAEAAGTGMVANQMYKYNQIAEADKQRKQSMEDQKHDLDVRKGTAQANKAEAENDFYSKTRAQALEEIDLGIENLKRKGKLDEARLVEQEFQNGNLKAAWDLTRREKESAIRARREQIDIQRKNAEKVPAAGQARADMLQLVKDAYPQEPGESEMQYKQRIAQIQLQLNSTSKGNNVTELLKLAELTEDDVERAELLAQAKAGIQGRQVPSAKPAPGVPATGRGGTKATAAQKADWIKRAQAANPGVPLAEIQRRADEKFK